MATLGFEITAKNDALLKAIKESEKAIETLEYNVEGLGNSISKSLDSSVSGFGELLQKIRIQKTILKDLEEQYKAVKHEFESIHVVSDDFEIISQQERISQLLGEVGYQVSEEKREFEALEVEYGRILAAQEKLSNAQRVYLTHMQEIREEMTQLIAEGKKESNHYNELRNELEKIGTAYKVVEQEKKQLTAPESGLTGMLSGITGVVDVFSAAHTGISVFVKDNETLIGIQKKLQDAHTLTISLSQISNALLQTKSFRISTIAKITQLWTAANIRLATSLGISTVAAQALMGILTLGLSVAITAIVVGINSLISKQRQASEEHKKFAESVASYAHSTRAEYEKLRQEWNSAEGNLEKQEELLLKNKEAYHKLGIEINNLTDADRLFNEGAEAFIESINKRAMAAAAMDLAAEKYKSSIQKMVEADKLPDTVTRMTYDDNPVAYQAVNPKKQTLLEEIEAENKEAKDFIKKSLGWDEEAWKDLEKAGLKSTETLRNNLEQWKRLLESGERNPSQSVQNLNVEKELNDRLQQIEAERIKKSQDSWQKSIDVMNDGFAKRYAQMELNCEKEFQAIKEFEERKVKEQQAVARLQYVSKSGTEDGFDFSKYDLQSLPEGLRPQDITARSVQMAQEANDAWAQVRLQLVKDEVSLLKEEESRFGDSLKRRLIEINDFYDARYEQALGNDELISKIEENRDREITKAKIDNNLKLIQNEEEINSRLMKLMSNTYLFEADRERDLLELRKSSLEKKKDQYIQLKNLTQEERYELELLEAELREVNEELGKVPLKKAGELLSVLKNVSSSLSSLGGEVGEVFSGLAEGIDTVMSSLDNINSENQIDRIGTAIQGVASLVNLVVSASQRRKAVEKDFYKNAVAFAHEYALALNEQLLVYSELSGSGFITDYQGKINDGFKALTDATAHYDDALSKLSDGKAKIDLRNAVDWGNVAKGTATGAVSGAAVGSMIMPVIGTAVGAVVGAVAGFFTGLFGGKKKKNEYAGLLEVFPELVDGAGNLNKELAQSIINTEQVDDNTKQLLENALEWADAMEAANEQIKEVVNDLAGDLGNSMKEAIVDAWRAGEDASVSMFDAASKSLESFIENLLYSTVFGDVFKQFEEELADSLNPVTGDGDVVDDYERFMKQMDERDEIYISLLEAIKKRGDDEGFNLWEAEEKKVEAPQSGGSPLASMTQETASQLLGQLRALRMDYAETAEFLRTTTINFSSIDSNLFIIQTHAYDLKGLAQNQLNSLVQIERNTLNTVGRLNQILDNGVKIKEGN